MRFVRHCDRHEIRDWYEFLQRLQELVIVPYQVFLVVMSFSSLQAQGTSQ